MLNKIKIYCLIIILLIILTNTSKSQIFKAELISGLNITQVEGDEVYGFKKWGSNVGLGVIIPFSKNKKWQLSTEILYVQKGAQERKSYTDTFPEAWKYRLFIDYLEVPLIIHLEDRETWTFGLGASWSRMVNVKEYINGKRIEETNLVSNPFKKDDFNAIFDLRFRIWKRLNFNFRYAYSITPIRKVYYPKIDTTRKMYNNILTFRLIYLINEKKDYRKSKKNIDV